LALQLPLKVLLLPAGDAKAEATPTTATPTSTTQNQAWELLLRNARQRCRYREIWH
jgi:hypothetical protein